MSNNFRWDFAESMDDKLFDLGEGHLDLPPERVLRYLEYGDSKPSRLISKRLDELIPKAKRAV